MTTAEEHRHIAEEFFRMAREAKTEGKKAVFRYGPFLVPSCGG